MERRSNMSSEHVSIQIPFSLTREELRLETGTENSILGNELHWLAQNATPEELPRILTSAVLLHADGGFPIADCLHTAIVWERG
jgi:hypothetical protein